MENVMKGIIDMHIHAAPDVRARKLDDLELMVDNQMWPLPKYRELLFIR